MAGGAAQVEAADRRAVVGPAGDGAEAEQLVGVHRPLHDVAAGDAERALQIERREDLAMFDRARHVGRVFGEHFDAAIGEGFFDVVPIVRLPPAESGAVERNQAWSSRSLYGAYCTNMLRMCLPGGAIVRSTLVGIVISRIGRSLGRPYLASSYARSK